MRRFRFPLDPVLRYRKLQEDLKKRDFAHARSAVTEQELRIAGLRRETDRAREVMQQVVIPGLQLREVLDHYRYINGQRARERRAVQRREELVGVMEPLREAYVEARRATLVIERLRERRQAAWRKEAEREERKELDEIANRAVFMRRRGAGA